MKKFALFLSLTILPQFAQANEWRWVGYEIFGSSRVPRAEIEAMIPFAKGTAFVADIAKYAETCERIRERFDFLQADCSAIRYVNFEAFFVVDVVERADAHRARFRAEPTDSVELATPEILETLSELRRRRMELFNQGIASMENIEQGYLSYDRAELATVVERLAELVPAYRENLFEVLLGDGHPEKRAVAAELLNWSRGPILDTVVRAIALTDDAHSNVRNNLSRFAGPWMGKLEDEERRRASIDHLVIQLDRPSHLDRNKALYGLWELAEKFPADRPYLRGKGLPLVKRIAQESILSNVREPAEEILKLLEEFSVNTELCI